MGGFPRYAAVCWPGEESARYLVSVLDFDLLNRGEPGIEGHFYERSSLGHAGGVDSSWRDGIKEVGLRKRAIEALVGRGVARAAHVDREAEQGDGRRRGFGLDRHLDEVAVSVAAGHVDFSRSHDNGASWHLALTADLDAR